MSLCVTSGEFHFSTYKKPRKKKGTKEKKILLTRIGGLEITG